ncbi:hypothetical protein [Pararhizobium polonicum]|uniref:hypothetical protein n=1 Tax=Pararhizobium polonicum TaxID=1612624 RepID=UPI00111219B0|nr:hypothetical protein [Pararhizobium polonicum]
MAGASSQSALIFVWILLFIPKARRILYHRRCSATRKIHFIALQTFAAVHELAISVPFTGKLLTLCLPK